MDSDVALVLQRLKEPDAAAKIHIKELITSEGEEKFCPKTHLSLPVKRSFRDAENLTDSLHHLLY